MRNMKDLILFGVFVYCLFNLYMSHDMSIFILTLAFSIIFFIRHICLKNNNYLSVLKNRNTVRNLLLAQKKYFSLLLTHDLKIPTLAQLRGLQALKNKNTGELNIEQREIISQIEYSCNYILDMISMIINTYQFEANEHKLIYEKFSMSELLIKCFEELSERSKEKNLTFIYTQSAEDTKIEADKKEIKRVIINLLNNAINHSFSGSQIEVNIYTSRNNLKLTISGMQLNFNEQNKLFNKSYSYIPEYSTIGQNIGMYLSKKIIEFHKGKIYSSHDTKVNNILAFEIPRYSRNLENKQEVFA